MKKEMILKIVTHLIAFVFLIIHIMAGNYEFIGHITISIILFWVALYFYKKYKFPFFVMVGFTIWMIMHVVGGLDLMIGGQLTRVYALILWDLTGAPLYFLKYDQVAHFYCYIVVGFIVYYVMRPGIKKVDKMMLFFMIIASIGVGAMNEIAEFTMVMALPSTSVGDYFNNAFDLVTNALGAIVGVLWAHNYYLKKKK